MSKRTAYFSSGEVIEHNGGRAAFLRSVRLVKKYSDGPIKVWYRPTDEWREAVKETCDAWARQRGFVSWEAYQFIQNILNKKEDEK